MQDNSEGQAKDTMAAWDTILSLQQKLVQERQLIKALYEQMILKDQCVCGNNNNNHQSSQSKSTIIDLIKTRQIDELDAGSENLESFDLLKKAIKYANRSVVPHQTIAEESPLLLRSQSSQSNFMSKSIINPDISTISLQQHRRPQLRKSNSSMTSSKKHFSNKNQSHRKSQIKTKHLNQQMQSQL